MASPKANEPNDRALYRDAQGLWRLWACVRNTSNGRVLICWIGSSRHWLAWHVYAGENCEDSGPDPAQAQGKFITRLPDIVASEMVTDPRAGKQISAAQARPGRN